jgi:hypothetical protein
VGVLEFGAVNLDKGLGISKKRFRKGFDYARFAGAGRAKKKQVANRTARGIQAGQEHLVDFHNLIYRLILSNDTASQGGIEFCCIAATPTGVKHRINTGSHKALLRQKKRRKLKFKMKRTARGVCSLITLGLGPTSRPTSST